MTNMVEHKTELVATVSKLHIITELYMAASIMCNEWWYDSGATIHVSMYATNKNHFKYYEVAKDGQKVPMRNYNAAKLMGKGNLELNFTFEKKLLLINILHVPNIRKILYM